MAYKISLFKKMDLKYLACLLCEAEVSERIKFTPKLLIIRTCTQRNSIILY